MKVWVVKQADRVAVFKTKKAAEKYLREEGYHFYRGKNCWGVVSGVDEYDADIYNEEVRQ